MARVWIETTRAYHQHGGAGWEFGSCLWSPARNKAGRDSYALMRAPEAGDTVYHFYDNEWDDGVEEMRFCAVSKVANKVVERADEPPLAGDWAGREGYYRIDLEDFVQLDAPLSLAKFRATYVNELLAELVEDTPRHYPFAQYRDEVRTNQGAYLTEATGRLQRLLAEALGIEMAGAGSSSSTSNHMAFAEGQRQKRETYFFARHPHLAKQAKAHYGLECMACGFDFEEFYGPLGAGYAECHHLNPLAERPEAEWSNGTLTLISEVAILCANCHRMVHTQRPPIPVKTLREAIESARDTGAPSPKI